MFRIPFAAENKEFGDIADEVEGADSRENIQ